MDVRVYLLSISNLKHYFYGFVRTALPLLLMLPISLGCTDGDCSTLNSTLCVHGLFSNDSGLCICERKWTGEFCDQKLQPLPRPMKYTSESGLDMQTWIMIVLMIIGVGICSCCVHLCRRTYYQNMTLETQAQIESANALLHTSTYQQQGLNPDPNMPPYPPAAPYPRAGDILPGSTHGMPTSAYATPYPPPAVQSGQTPPVPRTLTRGTRDAARHQPEFDDAPPPSYQEVMGQTYTPPDAD